MAAPQTRAAWIDGVKNASQLRCMHYPCESALLGSCVSTRSITLHCKRVAWPCRAIQTSHM
eukprot:862081-Alexandrium_andersonii.AAC.1